MSSSGSGNSSNNPNHGFPPMDNRFQDMRDKMNRDREAFFGTDSPQPFFGRESPFFRVSTLFFFRQITEVQFFTLGFDEIFSNPNIVLSSAHAAEAGVHALDVPVFVA